MTTNFYLESKPNKDNTHTLYLYLRKVKKIPTIKINTKIKIKLNEWNENSQTVRKSVNNSDELNNIIEKFKEDAKNTYKYFDENNLNTKKQFLDVYSKITSGITVNKNSSQKDFKEAYNEYINIKKPKISNSYYKKLKTLLNYIIEYSTKNKISLSFKNISLSFYEQFTNYLVEEKELSDNTIYKLSGYMKTFIKWAQLRKYHSNNDYQSFSYKTYDTLIIALSKDELDRIINLDLSDNTRLAKVRDILVFSCHTGQRISDILNLSKDKFVQNSNGHYFLQLKTQKTKEFVNILLSKTAESIYQRYFKQGEGFLKISSVKYNKHLKTIAKMAEIDTPITKYKYSGNKRSEETKPKYEFVASHIGRKTFITLSLEKGMRPEVLMKIVGIRDYKTLKKYIDITDRAKVSEMSKYWGDE